MKKLIHKFDITPDDRGLQWNISNSRNVNQNGFVTVFIPNRNLETDVEN